MQVHQHDDEEKQHHDAAAIDEHLHGGDELGMAQQEERRHRQERGQQRDRAVHRIAQRDHQDGAADGERAEEVEQQGVAVGDQEFGH